MTERATTFDKSEAERVAYQIREAKWKSLYDKVKDGLDHQLRQIFDSLPSIVPVVDSSLITLRVNSLQLILETVKEQLGVQYSGTLREAGEQVGATFGHELVKTLRERGGFPKKRDALLQMWAIFDSSADWGKISYEGFEETKSEFILRMESSFLTRDYEKDVHAHCSFMEGYIRGVLDESFTEWAAWVREDYEFAAPGLVCISVEEDHQRSTRETCVFKVKIGKDELPKSKEIYVSALRKFDKLQFDDAVEDSRAAMEFAAKEKLMVSPDTRLSFFRCVKAYEKLKMDLPMFETSLRVYDMASQVVHKKRKPSREEAFKTLFFVRRFIHNVEQMPLTNEQRKQLYNLSLPPPAETQKADPLGILDQKISLLIGVIETFRAENKEDHQTIIRQTGEIKDLCIKYARTYPVQVAGIIQSENQELVKILAGIQETLKETDLEASQQAEDWKSKLLKGVDMSANVVGLVTFISGIPSLQGLMGSVYSVRSTEFLKDIMEKLRAMI